jgi:hypothetical protein
MGYCSLYGKLLNIWETSQPMQQNGAAVCINGNVAQLQITNQYVQPAMLSILLLL